MNVYWFSSLVPYKKGLELQRRLRALHEMDADRGDDLILLEHEPVYTIGRTRDHHSLGAAAHLPSPVYEIHRGGQATYHGPGQLTGYPIVDLNRRRKDIHAYVACLEKALIAACAHWGVQAASREGLTGVWVGVRKLASIGIGVRKWVTAHGFAVNVTPVSLPPFRHIIPCGLDGVVMTCLQNEGAMCSTEEFSAVLAPCLESILEAEMPVRG